MTDWAGLTWPEVAEAVERQPVALLPFGAVEEHGPHLPLGTDVLAADGLAERLANTAGLLRLPTVPYGQVWSLEHFPGSLSVRDETLVALVTDLAGGLSRAGVRGIVLFSAHLGNAAALRKAARTLAETGGLPAIALTYPGLAEVAKEVRESADSHPSIMHADEIETSVLLALAPDHVRMDRAVTEYPVYPQDFDAAPVRWDTVSRSGVFGDATAATPGKGERVVDHVVRTAADLIAGWRKRVGV
ncbi:creatininase family protein [Jiangella aurantiaca]|uniref:Creatininase family protein n=1 Tax=Jiangella aurantiaca TaxID=2530373 RepID=A0A4R5AJT2_9ACTN|nr:creatininase family protein [Jiangella aurantiaca]TDD71254.1 creatininase family protein [Jiangella aurantiaca]